MKQVHIIKIQEFLFQISTVLQGLQTSIVWMLQGSRYSFHTQDPAKNIAEGVPSWPVDKRHLISNCQEILKTLRRWAVLTLKLICKTLKELLPMNLFQQFIKLFHQLANTLNEGDVDHFFELLSVLRLKHNQRTGMLWRKCILVSYFTITYLPSMSSVEFTELG